MRTDKPKSPEVGGVAEARECMSTAGHHALCAYNWFPCGMWAQVLSDLLIIQERLENPHFLMKYLDLPIFTFNFSNYVPTSFLKHF